VHAAGLVHRDFKPGNVLLRADGHAQVTDFGLVRVEPGLPAPLDTPLLPATAGEALTAAGALLGTPAYMAPEQLLGQEVTVRSDIYALGLVLYELFSGRRAFTAATLNDLIEQHQSGDVTPPSRAVTSLDPAIDRAILRCLDPNPAARPASARAVAGALPGGDPLAAAIAAGETPSPEMVAAAGEGAGLGRAFTVALMLLTLTGLAMCYALSLHAEPLQRLQPEFNADVLAQKARDALRALGYSDRPVDEAYGFFWNEGLRDTARTPGRDWRSDLDAPPSPLQFWYRRSATYLQASTFHHDLLTPGIVTPTDPAPTAPGMMQVVLDSRGQLMELEAIPPQVQPPLGEARPPNWATLLALASLDAARLQPAEPHWHWLASADARAAWTGVWPGRQESLRVEAAALHGVPVAFQMIGPWTTPSRVEVAAERGEIVIVSIYFVLVLCIVIASGLLAGRHLRAGRGDRAGAIRLAASVTITLWAIWLCQVHVSPSIGMIGVLLLAIVTTTFYGLLFWTIYLAIEPFVRRHWPQTLVSWTTVLAGRVRDPIVARDVLIGVGLGVLIAVLIRAGMYYQDTPNWISTDLLLGSRAVAGYLVMQALYALRSALFVFFLLFMLRVLLRRQIAAAVALVALFATLDALDSAHPLFEGAMTALYFSMLAAAVLRWGIVTLSVAMLSANLVLSAPATTRLSAWYIDATALTLLLPLALAVWAFVSLIGSSSGQSHFTRHAAATDV
jgi:serine/threonine-protein kinase